MSGSTGKNPLSKVLLRSFGNVFFGIAVGLLSYYVLTDLFTLLEQRRLASELGSAANTVPTETIATTAAQDDAFDLNGWEEEDRAYFEGLSPGQPLGRLVARPMGLDSFVVKGTSSSDLTKGPGWITWSDLPGDTGNFGVAGHRVTYKAPFRHIEKLQVGDTVSFISPYREYTYEVVDLFQVAPNRGDVAESTEKPMLTMVACHPPYSARYRYIAQAELVSVRRIK
ncbi:MAG: class E sortase [Coriobacteriia bacterium]|nr:class E sortase [Coriobacteriia bacterium]